MATRISISEFLEVFGITYRSLDIRTVAMREADHWTSLLTVVRAGYEEPESVAQSQAALVGSHGKVKTEDFQIAMAALPFSNWPQLVKDCSDGLRRFGDSTFQLQQKINLEEHSGYIQRDHTGLRQIGRRQWPGLGTWLGNSPQQNLNGESLVRQMEGLGWSSLQEVINELCGTSISPGMSLAHELGIFLPVFGMISDVWVSRGSNVLSVSLIRHRGGPALNVVVTVKEPKADRTEAVKLRRQVTLKTSRAVEGTIDEATATVDLPTTELADVVEVKVVHATLGQMDSVRNDVRALIPESERNVLWEALKYFCPTADLTQMLVKPYETQSQRLKESAAFELHVAWLLSLCGLSPIVLGEYEHLLAKNTKVQRASADIIAAGPDHRWLAVIACTLSTTNEADIANLVHVCEILRRETFAGTSVSVQPIIFTGAVGYGSYKEVDGLGPIPVVDPDGAAALLRLVQTGEERRFLEFLDNPAFFPLDRGDQIG